MSHASRSALVLGLAVLVAGRALPAQTVQGVVREDGSRTPILGAVIELVAEAGSAGERTQSDSLGAFQLTAPREGRYFLQLGHHAYAPLTSDTFSVARGETVTIELRLSPAAIPLEPLIVVARSRDAFGGFYERAERAGFGRFITRSEIAARPGARVTDLLQGVPGVYITRTSQRNPGLPVNLIALRGGAGRCLPTIFLDGMPMRQLPESGVDQFLVADMLEGVEIYSTFASVPSKFNTLDGCGVVAFWTRTDGRRPFSWKRLAMGLAALTALVLVTR